MTETINKQIPIIIPAYEPDERFIELLHKLKENGLSNIVIVNDGSDSSYDEIFDEARRVGVVLTHEVNKGKGRALKTAFSYVLENIPEAVGVVTGDCDGQHTLDSINNVISTLNENKDSLVLGVRSFDKEDIPWKSRFGNNVTLGVLRFASGLSISDTQTGLRGIPISFMEKLLEVPGERFEFETRMLLESVGTFPIVEVPIETIYDSKENHQTHFKPVADSVRIYSIFLEKFVKYVISSLSSFVIDIVLFTIFCTLLKGIAGKEYILYATVGARVLSSLYNYLINCLFVFNKRDNKLHSLVKYYGLVVVQMLASAGLVTLGVGLLQGSHETIVKIIVDTILFLVSYQVQRRFVFAKR